MSTMKIIVKQAIDTIEEMVPKVARGVAEKSTKLSTKTRQIKQQIEAKDVELAGARRAPSKPRDHDAPDRVTPAARGHDGPTVDVEVRRFTRNPKHDAVEYQRQLDEQLAAIREIPLDQWQRNRADYGEAGRTAASEAAQRQARENALQERILELREQGLSRQDATEQANEWLRTQAATHRLDGIAGGDQVDISGVGDSPVNSSLGSQWRHRVAALDAAVAQYVLDHPGVDLSTVRFDITWK